MINILQLKINIIKIFNDKDLCGMVMRNLLIKMYLCFFKIFYYIFYLLPIRKKVTFITTFGDNCVALFEEMKKQNFTYQTVFLYKKSCEKQLENIKGTKKIRFESVNLINEIRSIFHIATSRYIIIDNYFGFLSTIHFKKNVECIQLWHAVGAFKKFGLKDHTFEDRPISDKKRILKVYKQFHKIVVGSDKMAAIFMAAFNVDRKNILPTGIPRTDLFFDDMKKRTIAFDWLKDYPTLENKKIIMYAPTFRDNELKNFKLHLDLFLLQKKLGEEYAIILKLHPAISNEKNYVEKYPGFVYDFSSYKDVNKLLIITDILITDYSSIPFEYALLNRPIIFFTYDLAKYRNDRGLWEGFEQTIPGPNVSSTSEIISIIKEQDYDFQQISEFALEWNKYSQGNSSEKLVEYLLDNDGIGNKKNSNIYDET